MPKETHIELMDSEDAIIENLYTRPPAKSATVMTLLFTLFLLSIQLAFSRDLFMANQLLPASAQAVFNNHDYYRLWSTLFAHADLGHLMSNLILLVPLTYLFLSYFGAGFILFGLGIGGVVNAIVLETLPQQTLLIGISGVVYFLGAAWLTLFLLIDRRERLRRRIARVFLLSFLFLVPETYQPQVSYSSHFLGFLVGIISALTYYKRCPAQIYSSPQQELDNIIEIQTPKLENESSTRKVAKS